MSRGPGKLQNAIQKLLAETPDGVWTFETMRWSLYESEGKASLPEEAKLPTAWNTSFRRAVNGLAERRLLRIDERPLESFEECVEHYPGKTLQVDHYSMRKALLPSLLEWSREKNGLRPKYDTAANEKHHLSRISKEILDEIRLDWEQLEDRLRPLYGQTTQGADDLLRLICKGRLLFRKNDISIEQSFANLIEKATELNLLPASLLQDLQIFVNRFMPEQKTGNLKFRSFIHELAKVPNNGQCSLKIQTLEYLHQHHKELVESMEGFELSKYPQLTSWPPSYNGPKYDSNLVKLFDHTVFQDFKFLKLNK